jgi:hypothetical protein
MAVSSIITSVVAPTALKPSMTCWCYQSNYSL